MAFDVVMFGALSIPQHNREDWLTSPVDAGLYPWLDELGGHDVLQSTPEALLEFLSDVTTAPHELFSCALGDERIEVQCYVGEDTFRQTSQAVALLCSSAAAFGGVGDAFIAGYQGIRFGERLTVRDGKVSFARVTSEELARLETHPAFVALDAKIHERFDLLVGRPVGLVDPRRSAWMVHPFTGRKVRVAESTVR